MKYADASERVCSYSLGSQDLGPSSSGGGRVRELQLSCSHHVAQWFSTGNDFAPQRTSLNDWRHF